VSELVIEGLRAAVGGKEILSGIDLRIGSGEVHAVMGPNGSGKSTLSHVLMGRPGYTVLGGSVRLDGVELLGLTPWERAQAGLFLAMQYPTEVDGVTLEVMLEEALLARGAPAGSALARLATEAGALEVDRAWFTRGLNVDMSGGEKKRNETLQLAVLQPRFAVLDEIDSGLDVDALRLVSGRVEAATHEGLGVLAITHYRRLLDELQADVVHVFARGRIQESGGPELVGELEANGYERFLVAEPAETVVGIGLGRRKASAAVEFDPFAEPM
jgi:Fe-S cluster assembly ATP-binding protein